MKNETINGKPYDYAGNTSEDVEIFELEIGNLVYVQGLLFRIKEIQFYQPHDLRNPEETVVRYLGKLVDLDRNKQHINTGYDNSWYGHNQLCKATRIKTEYQNHQIFNK